MDALDQSGEGAPVDADAVRALSRLGVTLALAPMEGVTSPLVRALYAELGGVDYCVTEFIRVTREGLSERALRRDCPELDAGGRTPTGVPVHVQLLGGEPERMAEAAAMAAGLGALVVDLNFGCPAPTVNKSDGGASLLRTPGRVLAVTRAVRDAVPAAIPVSAKVRLGWEDPADVLPIAREAEAGGASWLTIHGRTKAQGYAPPADWRRIGEAARAISIPVVANGDLAAPGDLVRCHEVTGCTRFMLGRGAIARPELFRVLRGELESFAGPTWRLAFLREFLDRSDLAYEGPHHQDGVTGRCKQWCRAMAAVEPEIARFFEGLKRVRRIAEARAALTAATEALRDEPRAA